MPRNMSQLMSLSIWTICGSHSSMRYNAVCQIAKGRRNSTHNKPPETSCVWARTERTPSMRLICAAITALNGTSSEQANTLITKPKRMSPVCSLNWATSSARDLAGLGGGMNRHKKMNASAHVAIMIGPHHTHSRWAVMFMFILPI